MDLPGILSNWLGLTKEAHQQAAITGLFQMVGVFVTGVVAVVSLIATLGASRRQVAKARAAERERDERLHEAELERDDARRQERIRDLQVACLAEIQGNREQFAAIDLDAHAAEVRARMADEAAFTPFAPRDASTVVFDAILPDVHILPSRAIFPMVAYYKQVMRIAHIVDDLKSENYAKLDVGRKFEIYLDYLGMIKRALHQSDHAETALRSSLGAHAPSNIQGVAQAAQSQWGAARASKGSSSKSPSEDI